MGKIDKITIACLLAVGIVIVAVWLGVGIYTLDPAHPDPAYLICDEIDKYNWDPIDKLEEQQFVYDTFGVRCP